MRPWVDYVPSALLPKHRIIPNDNVVVITTTNCAMVNNWNSYVPQSRSDLDNIPKSNVNGPMTNEQRLAVSNAMDNALNHISDHQQFKANGNSR